MDYSGRQVVLILRSLLFPETLVDFRYWCNPLCSWEIIHPQAGTYPELVTIERPYSTVPQLYGTRKN